MAITIKTINGLAASVSYDTDAQAFFDRVTTNASTYGASLSTNTKGYVDTFVKAAKANSYWTKIKRCNLLCGSLGSSGTDTQKLAAVLTPLVVGSGNDPEANTGSFAVADYAETGTSAGLKGDGSSKYFDTGYNPRARSLAINSIGLFVYVKGVESAGSSRAIISAYDGFMLDEVGWMSGGSVEGGILVDTNNAPSSNAAGEGFRGAARNGNYNTQYYDATGAVGSAVTGSEFSDQPNSNFMVGCRGNLSAFSTRYIRAYFITSGMSAADVANLNTDVAAFQTSLSRNV